jgi:hypothetical protein
MKMPKQVMIVQSNRTMTSKEKETLSKEIKKMIEDGVVVLDKRCNYDIVNVYDGYLD